MMSGDSDKPSPDIGIAVWRTLAHQIGPPEQTVRSWRGGGCLFVHPVVEPFLTCASHHLIPKPSKGQTCGLCNAHEMPPGRNRVAERV